MKNWITNNYGLKLVSLALAIITWIYVKGELVKREIDPTSVQRTSSWHYWK